MECKPRFEEYIDIAKITIAERAPEASSTYPNQGSTTAPKSPNSVPGCNPWVTSEAIGAIELIKAIPYAATTVGTITNAKNPQPTTAAPLAEVESFLAKSAPDDVQASPKIEKVKTEIPNALSQSPVGCAKSDCKPKSLAVNPINKSATRVPIIPTTCCALKSTRPPKIANVIAPPISNTKNAPNQMNWFVLSAFVTSERESIERNCIARISAATPMTPDQKILTTVRIEAGAAFA